MEKCPICDSLPSEEEWGSCIEIRGRCWQQGTIKCSNPQCYHSVTIDIDSDGVKNASAILSFLWDELAKLSYLEK